MTDLLKQILGITTLILGIYLIKWVSDTSPSWYPFVSGILIGFSYSWLWSQSKPRG